MEEGRRRGLLGPGDLVSQREHALGFGAALGEDIGEDIGEDPTVPTLALDLGSGGGLPGLVLAAAWPTSRWVLLDGRERSATFLAESAATLDLIDRVVVVCRRAEEAGRDAEHRGRYDLVVARGFGPPAATAECAAPFLRVGGRLVVSEPPGSTGERWPAEPLARLGLRFLAVSRPATGTFALLEQAEPCPEAFPRRTGVPVKRLLFGINSDPDVSRETRAGP